MGRKTRFSEFVNEFLNSAKPQTVSEICSVKKLNMHQSIGQRMMKGLVRHKGATLYVDTKQPSNKQFYGPTPAGLMVAAGLGWIKKEKYEKLFDRWAKHDKFQVELSKEISKISEVDTIKDYKILVKSTLELWVRAFFEYNKIKDDIPLRYQYLIGKEILKKNDPKFWAEYSEFDFPGWAED